MLTFAQTDRKEISKLRDQSMQDVGGDKGQGGVRRSVSPE